MTSLVAPRNGKRDELRSKPSSEGELIGLKANTKVARLYGFLCTYAVLETAVLLFDLSLLLLELLVIMYVIVYSSATRLLTSSQIEFTGLELSLVTT